MGSKRILTGLLSIAVATSSTIASANSETTQNGVLDRVGQMIKDQQLEIIAEMALIDVLIHHKESTQAMNESLALDKANVYVMVPTVFVAGVAAIYASTSIGGAIVKNMTPEKTAWFTNYRKIKANLKGIEKDIAMAAKVDPITITREAMVTRSGMLETAQLKAKLQLSEHLLQKPGMLYKVGRLVRFTAATSIVLGGVSIGVYTANETMLLVFGREEFAKSIEKLRERSAQLEAMLKI
jgi:hypothetical protein